MIFRLRFLHGEEELPRIVELANMVNPETTSIEIFRERYLQAQLGLIEPIVAVDESETIVGYVMLSSTPYPNHLWMRVIVDPLKRNCGAGTLLYNAAFRLAQVQDATDLLSDVRENCPAGLQFAQHRGFSITRHILVSRLPLAPFDEGRFAGTVEAVEATGIRFFTLADVQVTPEFQQKHYDLYCQCARDNPATADWDFPPLEAYCQRVFDSPRYRAYGHVIAVDGETWIGMAVLDYYAHVHCMHNAFTGVARSYRGRHIGLALKLLALHNARMHGVDHLYTNNDSANAPMLAINRKLGYQFEPGVYMLSRSLENTV